jgi:uncharacterized FlaG/YvyC family protein
MSTVPNHVAAPIAAIVDVFDEADPEGHVGMVVCPSCAAPMGFPDDTQDPLKCGSCGSWFQVEPETDSALRIAARYKDMTPIGEVGVDSGALVLIDPAYIKYWDTGKHPELSREHFLKMISLEGEAATQFHFENGAPAAVLIPSTGGGDGGYPVYVERVEDETGHGGSRDWSAVVDFNPRGDHKMASRVAARYKSKKKIKTQKGKEMTVYEYSDRQIANRNRAKAKKLEKLSKSIGELRKKVKRDMRSSDPEKMLLGLAVALMDHTYERVGNEESAKDGHVGVTGWQRKHVSFGRGGVTIKYVGKSGVEHKKKITDAGIKNALRDAYEAVEDDDAGLFSWEGGSVTAEKVNAYLKPFGVTAKDIRGFHANNLMREALVEARKGKLPEDKKARAKQLKAEFLKALDETAATVGHEPSTLRSQYLVPGLEESFVKDGTIMEKLGSTSDPMATRVLARYLSDELYRS